MEIVSYCDGFDGLPIAKQIQRNVIIGLVSYLRNGSKWTNMIVGVINSRLLSITVSFNLNCKRDLADSK